MNDESLRPSTRETEQSCSRYGFPIPLLIATTSKLFIIRAVLNPVLRSE